MVLTVEAYFDGSVLHPAEPIELEPNTHVRLTIETIPSGDKPKSFLQTARNLNLEGPSDWSRNLEAYLYEGKAFDDE